MDRPAEVVADDEVVLAVPGRPGAQALLALGLPMLTERCDRPPIEIDVASASRCLRRAHDQLVPGRGDRVSNGEPREVEVDIAPAESEDLSAPHTGSCEQSEADQEA